jgi:hypothetical protein
VVVINFWSADPAVGAVRNAEIQFAAVGQPALTYTLTEDAVVAGRYTYRQLAPGTYIVRARRIHYAPIHDTVTVIHGLIDSAEYRTYTLPRCLLY